MPRDPAAAYRDRLAALHARRARLDRADARVSHARLATVGLAAAVVIVVWRGDVTPWMLAVPGGVLLLLIGLHDRVLRARAAADLAIACYERGLARIEDRWIGTGEPGARFSDEHHPYAIDLDIFGTGSLFELLSTARTSDGEEALARWLTAAAPPEVIRARQEAIAELADGLPLREGMAVAGRTSRIVVDTARLREWAQQEVAPTLTRIRLTTGIAGVATGAAATFAAVTGNLGPLVFVFVSQLARQRIDGEQIASILQAAGGHARELDTLGELFQEIESARFSASSLLTPQAVLTTGGRSAAMATRALQRLSERYEWSRSLRMVPMFLLAYALVGTDAGAAPLALALASASAFLLLGPMFALAVERWRRAHGPHVGAWIAALAEFEALLALAAYRFEHPDDPFPIVVADASPPAAIFEGTGLGHPLLPASTVVRNDVWLNPATQLLVVSGSNMSGKSTLLRTVGVNAVLALAGAPVRAVSLRISPLSIGATLRIQDSLRDGRSRFMAEIIRIRELVDLAAGPMPLLFLLDELLHGTNSHDRRAGASGILRALLARGAIGLMTTHDLALTAIAGELAPRAVNVHFDDDFDGDEIRFDYRVKSGPVTRSNALALMRSVGLDVQSASRA